MHLGDAGWDGRVRADTGTGAFGQLVETCAPGAGVGPTPRRLSNWYPVAAAHDLVPDFARRLAVALNLPFDAVLEKTDNRPEQKTMANSTQQARNIDGSLAVSVQALRAAPVLLVDDMVDSRWTLTVAAWLLRSHGSGEVFPLALALTGYEK